MKTCFWCDLTIKVFICLTANLGRHILKTNIIGLHFSLECHGFYPELQGFSTNQNYGDPAPLHSHHCFQHPTKFQVKIMRGKNLWMILQIC